MGPLDPKVVSTGDPADARRKQRIEFCKSVADEVAREFAEDQEWRKCFVIEKELSVRQLLQGTPQPHKNRRKAYKQA